MLKTALMISDVDLRFRVSNFTQANMRKVEEAWLDIEKALLRAATLMSRFGFSERTLTADSVVIPVAYYLHKRGVSDSSFESSGDSKDRELVRAWVTRSLIKRGIWGSGLDTTLTRVRDVLDQNAAAGFPVAAVESAMASVGKWLAFDETEIDELLGLKYNGQRTFAVLSVLYPGLDFSKAFHEDHVFPKSRFTAKRLLAAGVQTDAVADYQLGFNLLPNLQLLVGIANQEQLNALPDEWVAKAFATEAQRATYLVDNDLDGLPFDIGRIP